MTEVAPEASKQGIIDFVAEKANAYLKDNGSPYLLNHISPDLKKFGIDYKPIIEPLKLREFLIISGEEKFKIVNHPTVKAKIAVVPKDSDFEFSDEPQKDPVTEVKASKRTNERAIVDFVRALSTLSDSDLDGFSIPAKILARLYSK